MKSLFLASFFTLIFISCNMNTGQNPQQTYEQKVKSIAEIERDSPLNFLTLDNLKWERDGIFFIDHYATGTVINNATVAYYKDVTIETTYQTKTQTEIGKYIKTIYEYFPPHSQKKFSFPIKPPAYCENISLRITSATPVSNPPVNTNSGENN